jgi:cbb3-type cytochrome oxidase maturation protein
VFVFIIAIVFWWNLKSGQFEDLEGPGYRILMDDDNAQAQKNSSTQLTQIKVQRGRQVTILDVGFMATASCTVAGRLSVGVGGARCAPFFFAGPRSGSAGGQSPRPAGRLTVWR